MAKELTWKDIMDTCQIKDGMEQQIFLLSRFFNMGIENVQALPLQVIHPMMAEMNEYFESIDHSSGFKMEEFIPNPKSPNIDERVESRSQILDL